MTVVPLSLINGLVYPHATIGLLATYFAGRQAFSYGYQEKEGASNPYQIAGNATVSLVHILTIGTTLFMASQLIRGRPLLQKAFAAATKQ